MSSYNIFSSYNVRMSVIQVNLTVRQPNEQYNQTKKEANVFITMAPPIDKNISMDVVRQGGVSLFNYNDKIVMKMETHELAAFARLKNPYYLKLYTNPAVDDAGRQKTDQRGNAVTHTDDFVHQNRKNNTTTGLKIGGNQRDPNGISISMYLKQGQGYKNAMIYLTSYQTYELACACEWALTKIWEETSYEYTSNKTSENKTSMFHNSSDDDMFGKVSTNVQPNIVSNKTISLDNMLD